MSIKFLVKIWLGIYILVATWLDMFQPHKSFCFVFSYLLFLLVLFTFYFYVVFYAFYIVIFIFSY